MKISTIKKYNSNMEVFIEDKNGDTVRNVTFYADNYDRKKDIPAIADIREEYGLTWKLAREIKSEILWWMDGVKNNFA